MTDHAAFDEINEAKDDMDHIYNEPDPRPYYRYLEQLGYAIPGGAKPVFQKLISQLRQQRDDTIHILDLGCSYGVNAALLKYDLSMADLYEHWGIGQFAGATTDQVIASDRKFFADIEQTENVEVIGLDQAENAVYFAEDAGLLDQGVAVNLETEALPVDVMEQLTPVDLVTSTGCVGYVTERTFERLLPAMMRGRRPWLANFVLRMFPFHAIEKCLRAYGYVTEKLQSETFVQRRFASSEEQAQVLEQLRGTGVDPAGKEAQGYLHAEFYLSRPAAAAAEKPLKQLLFN